MKRTQPYQPLLLRLLHGLNGFFLIAAIVTAFWTYDIYDGRWGKLSLPSYQVVEGIHGTFGLYTLLIFPAFVIYSFHRGRKRLVQPNALNQLTQIGKPVWWCALNRFANTLSLIALTLALFSGKMMDETWLPKGELDHDWYYAHLISWVIMVGAIALHILMKAKVGGAPLLLSMLDWQFLEKDHPALWSTHVAGWWTHIRSKSWLHWLRSVSSLAPLEVLILVSLLSAWIISLFKQVAL
ncbi:MAG: cytochrome b/b6 domain-containing protein [Elainellaceae cyanobacterium]